MIVTSVGALIGRIRLQRVESASHNGTSLVTFPSDGSIDIDTDNHPAQGPFERLDTISYVA